MPAATRHRLTLCRPLRVDIEALDEAFDGQDPDVTAYLDLETGRVRFVADGEVPRSVVAGIGRRYVPVPQDEPSDVYADMEGFVGEIEDGKLRQRLRTALRAKDGGRRFRFLLWEEEIVDEWSVFSTARRRARIVDWLASIGIGAVCDDA